MLLKFLFAFVPLFCAQVVSQPPPDLPTRHLINFNKVSLGNLAALDMMMRQPGKYAHAHVVLNGVKDSHRAAGHFDDWNNKFRRDHSIFTTYGGRDPPEEGEWYESGFLGQARAPDFEGHERIQIEEGIIYDIHQVAPTRPEQHKALWEKIREGKGKIGSVYVQQDHNSQIEGNRVQAEDLPKLLNDIYRETEEGVIFTSYQSLDTGETYVPRELLKDRFPFAHLDLAQKDPFVAKTLFEVKSSLKKDLDLPLLIPPYFFNRLLPKARLDMFCDFVQDAVAGFKNGLRDHLSSWILNAKEKGTLLIAKSTDEEKRLRTITQVNRLDKIMSKLKREPIMDYEVEFADALFTTALLSDGYKRRPVWYENDDASSSRHSSSTKSQRSKQKPAYPTRIVSTYRHLPHEVLLETALKYFPKRLR